jgi:hypothetical protein
MKKIPKFLRPADIMEPEEAAKAVRALCRNGLQYDERDLILELCAIAVHSKNAGESASMERYAEAVAAGRRIKHVIVEIEMENDDEQTHDSDS